MRCKPIIVGAITWFVHAGSTAMAIEESEYTVTQRDGAFEVRDYTAHTLAETRVDGSMEEAGNRAFNLLFRYISGANRTREELAMTAPVSQERDGTNIAMTAPVSQERSGEEWTVAFMMPASYTLATLPEPTDPRVTLREVPARRMAAVRYSGFWSEANYTRHEAKLTAWMQKQQLEPAGPPVWARYNPPFTPWFLRRNEILIPVLMPTNDAKAD